MPDLADRLRDAARMSSATKEVCQIMEEAANFMENDMTEREAFVAWLEIARPPLQTTHDVEVAWRGWLARGEKVCTCAEHPSVTDPMCPACSESYEAAAQSSTAAI